MRESETAGGFHITQVSVNLSRNFRNDRIYCYFLCCVFAVLTLELDYRFKMKPCMQLLLVLAMN